MQIQASNNLQLGKQAQEKVVKEIELRYNQTVEALNLKVNQI